MASVRASFTDSARPLHSGGDEGVVSEGAVCHAVDTDVVLVNVNADNIAVVLQSSLNSGGVDAAAAGEDDLGAVGVPALHTGGDVCIAVELAAVEVVDVDVGAQLLSSSVSALHVAVAVTDDSGDSHAAEEAQLGLAVLNDSVASHITCLLLLEGDAVAVCRDGVGADVAWVTSMAMNLTSGYWSAAHAREAPYR